MCNERQMVEAMCECLCIDLALHLTCSHVSTLLRPFLAPYFGFNLAFFCLDVCLIPDLNVFSAFVTDRVCRCILQVLNIWPAGAGRGTGVFG